ncbi:TldD/PmbA family protein [Luteimonas sp. J29]|uniref:TldD/PmbA family protein n=1 Tax=Luteimonas sp. J29 TaxID=935863 RepID=UPI00047E328C|nr:TldD/PmbA family protein [Luteimonas sp. J29]
MQRRGFLALGGLAAGAALLPPLVHGRAVAAERLLERIDDGLKRRLADAALQAATDAGASYCDMRVGRYLRQSLLTREARVENVTNEESAGVGVRVIAAGAWGFAATNRLDVDAVANAARQAVAIASANARIQAGGPVTLAPAPGVGEVAWRTPIAKNGMEVPIRDKLDLLLSVNAAAIEAGASFVNSSMFLVNEQKYFASTDGSYIDQDVHRIWVPFTVTVIDQASGKFRTRNGLSAPMGMGYEYLDADPSQRFDLPGGVVAYGRSYDMREDAVAAARQAREKLRAPSVKPGRYDLVIDPSNLFLTIHENVGHPLELDRVLGYEANYAGTSFATLDKRGSFRWGSDIVNFVADRTQPGSLGAVGYDDEGVQAKRWDLVRDGILVDYQSVRDQAHILGKAESDGCCYADSWSSVQFQRMPNVSLQPGKAPLTVREMIAGVENGLYIHGRGSYSIDQQRYNAQFGGQLFFAIRNGEVQGLVEDAAYQIRTPEFWNACSAICDARDYRLGGSFFDGKGQPSQVSAVSHGAATARFDGQNVINTARSLG